MEEFEHSFDAENREWKSSSKVQGLKSEMNEFELNSDAWNREWKFEDWNRECRSSNQVRCLELEMEEYEPISKLGIGNEGVRAQFRRCESGM